MTIDLQNFSISVFSPSFEWLVIEIKTAAAAGKKNGRGVELTVIQRKSLIMGIGVGDAEIRPRTDIYGSLVRYIYMKY